MVFALVIVALSLWTAAGFLAALIWATILAIALWPLYAAFATRVTSGPSGWAAFVFTCFVAVILFTPMSLAIYQVAQQSGDIADWLKKARENGIEVPDWIARLPIAAEIAQQWWRANLSDPQAANGWLKAISADSASDLFNTLGGQLLHRMFMLFFSLVSLFVLLSNGRSVASQFLETSERILGRPGEGVVENIVEFHPRHSERYGRGRGRRGPFDWRRLSRRGRAKRRHVHHLHHRFCDASFRCLGSLLRCGAHLDIERKRSRGGRRLLLGSDNHARWRSFRVAGTSRRFGAPPLSVRFRRNLRRLGGFRTPRPIPRAGRNGGFVDGVARMGISTVIGTRSD